MTIPLGIGILAPSGKAGLQATIEAVERLTHGPHRIMVAAEVISRADHAWCKAHGIPVVMPREGAGPRDETWNANRALLALPQMGCGAAVILRERCRPAAEGWDLVWRAATAAHGFVAAAPDGFETVAKAGSGTATDPFAGPTTDARAFGVSAVFLEQLGFLDTRLDDMAAALSDLMLRARALRTSLVPKRARTPHTRAVLHIHGGLEPHRAKRAAKPPPVEDAAEPPRVPAVHTEEDRDALEKEMTAGGVAIGRALRADPARLSRIERIGLVPALRDALGAALEGEGNLMMEEGWLQTIASAMPVFRGEPVPWFNYAVVELLRERVRPDWRVFEFGAGYSTLWWSRHVREITAVEHHAGWIEAIRPLLDPARATILQREPSRFPTVLDQVEGAFDVIVVDGAERPACARAALPRLSPTGVLVFDNTHRAEYAEAVAEIEAAGFRQLRLTAPAPTTVRMETTSIFYRPGNGMGL